MNNRLLSRVLAGFSATHVLVLSVFILILGFTLWMTGKPTISPSVEAEPAAVAEAQGKPTISPPVEAEPAAVAEAQDLPNVPPRVEIEASATPAEFPATQYSMTGPQPPRPPGIPDEPSYDPDTVYVEGDDGVYHAANIHDIMVPIEDSSLLDLIKKRDRVDTKYYCLYDKSTGEWFAVAYEEYPPPTPVSGTYSTRQCQIDPKVANDPLENSLIIKN